MDEEMIVAVFDTAAHAEAAVAELTAAGVPTDAIHTHAGTGTGATVAGSTAAPAREPGFWSSLFGGEPDHDTAVYERSVEGGSTVVTVKAPGTHVTKVMEILETHHPIDIDERATGYGLTGGTGATSAGMGTVASTETVAAPLPPATGTTAATGQTAVTGDTVQLAEENLAVGKRVVNQGGTRIRRFVVETPVEQSVSLHSEKVILERRPVTDGRAVTDSFTDKTVEMMESAEEAVVSKTAHVYEEVGLRKEAADRVETVRDTVRKEEVAIEQIPGKAGTGTAATGVVPPPKV